MQPSYELFDHTADMGVRVFAPTLPALLQPAADGLYAVIGDLATIDDPRPVVFELAGTDSSLLLRDYLAELLHLFEHERRAVTDLDVREFTDRRLLAAGHTRPIDGQRSVYLREVKAVTYHELAVRKVPGGYVATYILDI